MEYTTNDKGEIGEAAFKLWCAKNRYVCGKASEKAPYDFFLDRNDSKILRVQVKYRTPDKDNRIAIKLKPTGKNCNNYFDYTNGCIDAIAVYNSDTAEMALVPIVDIPKDQSQFFLLCRESINPKSNNRFFKTFLV